MRVYLITKEKEVITEEVNPRHKFYVWHNGAYFLDPTCIRLSMKNGGINPNAEIIFCEGNPYPINSTNKEDKEIFNEIIYKNDLNSVAHVKNENALWAWLKSISPEKTILWITMGLLGIYLLWQFTHGGF